MTRDDAAHSIINALASDNVWISLKHANVILNIIGWDSLNRTINDFVDLRMQAQCLADEITKVFGPLVKETDDEN